MAHLAVGATCMWTGELHPAHRHLEESIARYTSTQRNSPLFQAGQDIGLVCLVFTAYTLWLRGYPDQARARVQDALALATELDHFFSYAFALNFASIVQQYLREGQEVYDFAEAAVALSTEQGFTLWLAMSTILRGWALAAGGNREEGLAQRRQGLTDYRASGAELSTTYFLSLITEAYGNLKQVESGLDVLQEGLEVVERTGERWYESELHRFKGQLLLQQSPDNAAEAETCFQQALEVSRHQQAKSLELRSSTSLAKLWQSQEKRQEARELLEPVYSWFTEGFDTADLIDAKALLDELS